MGGLKVASTRFGTDWIEGVREEAVSAVTFQSGFPDRQNVRESKIGVKEKIRIILR